MKATVSFTDSGRRQLAPAAPHAWQRPGEGHKDSEVEHGLINFSVCDLNDCLLLLPSFAVKTNRKGERKKQ